MALFNLNTNDLTEEDEQILALLLDEAGSYGVTNPNGGWMRRFVATAGSVLR